MGIPPEKVGILTSSNRATITEAEEIFTEEVINPMQSLFEFQVNIILNDDLGLNVVFSFTDRVYNLEKLAKISSLVKGLSVNEIRTMIFGLEKKEGDEYDIPLVRQTDTTLLEETIAEASGKSSSSKDKKYKDELKKEIIDLIKMRKELTAK